MRNIAIIAILAIATACGGNEAAPAATEAPAAAPAHAATVEKTAAATDEAAHDAHDASCTCTEGKEGGTMWCDKCGMGYIKGEMSHDKAAVDAAIGA